MYFENEHIKREVKITSSTWVISCVVKEYIYRMKLTFWLSSKMY